LPLFFTDSRKADRLIRQLTWHAASLSSLKVAGHVDSRLNQLSSEYDVDTRSATSLLVAFSRLYVQQYFQSAARLRAVDHLHVFFIVLIIARHGVFDIFVKFVISKAPRSGVEWSGVYGNGS